MQQIVGNIVGNEIIAGQMNIAQLDLLLTQLYFISMSAVTFLYRCQLHVANRALAGSVFYYLWVHGAGVISVSILSRFNLSLAG